MKIVFFCGSIDPGRDGVGDYTIRLSQGILDQGISGVCVALRDTCTTSKNKSDLRFRNALQDKREKQELIDYLLKTDPDWISLQYVPFAYHPRGLISDLIQLLKIIRSKSRARFHIMFHELWTGFSQDAPWKHRLLGIPQKWLLRKLVSKVKPDLMHTHAPGFRFLLSRIGVKSSILPLFSIVPISQDQDINWIKDYELTHLLDDRSQYIIGTLFGSIYPEWAFNHCITQFIEYAESIGKSPVILTIGNTGRGQSIWNVMVKTFSGHCCLRQLGFLSSNRISQMIHFGDFGIATTPLSIIEKSGSVATMLDHGLPVLVDRMDSRISGYIPMPNNPQIIFPDNSGRFDFAKIHRIPAKSSLALVACDFIQQLQEHSNRY